MLIQNISSATPATQPTGRVSSGAPVILPDTAAAEPAKLPSSAQLKSAVDDINHAMRQAHQTLEFSVDSATKTPIVKMTDTSTGQVIGQFPSEAALAIAQSIGQMQPGLLLKQKA